MTPAQAATQLRRKANALRSELKAALSKTARQGVAIGRAHSRGGWSLAALRKAGHPYAVQDPQTPVDPAEVNYQGGGFFQDWKATPASAFGGGLRAATTNNNKAAGFLNGRRRPKSRMVRRPIGDVVLCELRPLFHANVKAAVRKAMRTK